MVQGWRSVLLGLVVLPLFAAGCGGGPSRAVRLDSVKPNGRAAVKAESRAPELANEPARPAGDIQTLTLTVKLPEQTPGAGAGPNGGGCPKGALQHLLGIELANPEGIVISTVTPNGPGAKAGLKPGDSIVGCNGQPASCPSSLEPNLYTGEKPGQAVLTVERQGPAASPVKPSTKQRAKPAAK